MTALPPLICETESLAAACARMGAHAAIAIDTEFIRDTTYYAHLCLVQLASPDESVAIDPLADGIDLTPLTELLLKPDTIKVFHASKQDLEIFLRLIGALPRGIYDTQIAAMACGFGNQVGYGALVQQLLRVSVDKSSRFTDWSKRPLSPAQYQYALDDVIHLERAYHKLKNCISERGREHWVDEEMARICEPELYQIDANAIWTRIKHNIRKPQALNRLRHLGRWREDKAATHDKPRQRIIKDEILVRLAIEAPQSLSQFKNMRGIYKNVIKDYGAELVELLKKADAEDKSLWPQMPKKPPANNNRATSDLLKILLKHCADEAEVADLLIASEHDILELTRGKRENLKILTGWRYEVFGQWAEALLAGKIAITAEGNKTIIINR